MSGELGSAHIQTGTGQVMSAELGGTPHTHLSSAHSAPEFLHSESSVVDPLPPYLHSETSARLPGGLPSGSTRELLEEESGTQRGAHSQLLLPQWSGLAIAAAICAWWACEVGAVAARRAANR